MALPANLGIAEKNLATKVLTEKQATLLDAYCTPDSATYGNATTSGDLAEYATGAVYHALNSLSKEIIERANNILSTRSIKAIKIIDDTLDGDFNDTKKQSLICSTAQDILDRAGVSKKQQITIDKTEKIAVVILPAKDGSKELEDVFTPNEDELLNLVPVLEKGEEVYVDDQPIFSSNGTEETQNPNKPSSRMGAV
jgi:hypothetical protein